MELLVNFGKYSSGENSNLYGIDKNSNVYGINSQGIQGNITGLNNLNNIIEGAKENFSSCWWSSLRGHQIWIRTFSYNVSTEGSFNFTVIMHRCSVHWMLHLKFKSTPNQISTIFYLLCKSFARELYKKPYALLKYNCVTVTHKMICYIVNLMRLDLANATYAGKNEKIKKSIHEATNRVWPGNMRGFLLKNGFRTTAEGCSIHHGIGPSGAGLPFR